MSAQTMMIADTIAGMKQCLSKYHDCQSFYSPGSTIGSSLTRLCTASDSEDPYLRSSNRGNKLKRKAQYHSGGTTGRPGGAKAYKTVRSETQARLLVFLQFLLDCCPCGLSTGYPSSKSEKI